MLIQRLGCVPVRSLPAFARQDAHTVMLTYTPSHTLTHIGTFGHTVRKPIAKIKLFGLIAV